MMLGFPGATVGGPRIQLSAANVDAVNIDPGDAIAAYSLESDGDVVRTLNGIATDIGDWMSPKAAGLISSYEAMATVTSGSLTAGTTGSWLNLSSTRSWNVAQTVVGVKVCTITVEIRRVGTSVVLASAAISMSAQVD